MPHKNKEDKNAWARALYARTPKTAARQATLAIRMKAWRKKNPEKASANSQRCRKAHLEKARAYSRAYYWAHHEKLAEYRRLFSRRNHIKHKFGLSLEGYKELETKQMGRCAICGQNEKKLTIDHDHCTGSVRGLLCSNCNTGLGMFGDSLERLKTAMFYLRSFA